MNIFIANHRTSQAKLQQLYGDIPVLDVTSHGQQPWLRFSPFYPHGDIPVPFSPGVVSASVEGIWQGLKVFEAADIDPSKFAARNMKGLKRTEKTYGKTLGHREGVHGSRLLSYIEARRVIYLPSYLWVLENRLQDTLQELQGMADEHGIVLLDYETNCDIDNPTKPLSHAGLVKYYLEGRLNIV